MSCIAVTEHFNANREPVPLQRELSILQDPYSKHPCRVWTEKMVLAQHFPGDAQKLSEQTEPVR